MELILLADFGGLGDIGNIIIVAIVVLAASFFLEGIWVKGLISALIVAVVIAVVNYFIGPFLNQLAKPMSWLPFELAYIVVDAVIIYIADFFLKGFKVKSFIAALMLAGIITLVQFIL